MTRFGPKCRRARVIRSCSPEGDSRAIDSGRIACTSSLLFPLSRHMVRVRRLPTLAICACDSRPGKNRIRFETTGNKEILMKIVLSALTAVLAASSLLAQQPKKPQPAHPEMTAPKAGPEHDILKEEVGDWDATVEMLTPPGIPPSTGEEKCTLMGGLWVITDFRGDFAGHPFYGHGTIGWNPIKKKYVSTWVDSMATSIGFGESTYD